MKILVSGASGFVGQHLTRELVEHQHEVIAADLRFPETQNSLTASRHIQYQTVDITDRLSIQSLLKKTRPDAVVHLAGISHVTQAAEAKDLVSRINICGTHHFLSVIQELDLSLAFLFVSTSLVYGNSQTQSVNEASPVFPENTYAMSKLAGEQITRIFDSEKIRTYIARPFNHIGQGQSDTFVCPAFAKRILKAKDGAEVEVGYLDAKRDFSDVRDIVRAYRLILEKQPQKRLFVLGRGEPVTIREVFDQFVKRSGKNLKPIVNSALLRPADTAVVVADIRQAGEELAWYPRITFVESLDAVFEDMRSRLMENQS